MKGKKVKNYDKKEVKNKRKKGDKIKDYAYSIT
jgi:hypothetical protein